jgi:hypothetical protein
MKLWTLAVALVVVVGCTAHADNGEEKKPNKNYTVAATTNPEAVKKDTAATYAITITPKAPWVLKPETPLKITLAPTEGLKVDKTTLTAKDLVDPKTKAKSVQTGVAAGATGEHKIAADMSFFLCKEDICQRFKDKVETTVTCE